MSKSDNIRVNLYAVRDARKCLEVVERYPMDDAFDTAVGFVVKQLKMLDEILGEKYSNTPAEPCVDGDADMFEN